MTASTSDQPLAEKYRKVWQGCEGIPDLASFLKNHPTVHGRTLLDVVLVDQYQRWQAGQPIEVEELFYGDGV